MTSTNSILMACVLLLLTTTQVTATELPKGIIESVNRTAPVTQLSDMDGKSQNIAQYRGRWVFVHFWASWCGPCRKEMPHIQKLVTSMQEQGLAFMIINTAESEDTVFAFLGGVAPELNSLMDRDGLVTERWQPRGLPATYLVDPVGIVRYQALGGRPWHKEPYMNFLKALSKSDT